MDCGKSLIIPPLFDSTNYVGWNKPEEPPASWDDTKIKAKILILEHLMLCLVL